MRLKRINKQYKDKIICIIITKINYYNMLFPDDIMRHINEYNGLFNFYPPILQKIFNTFSIPKLVALIERSTILYFKNINVDLIRNKILKIFFDTKPSKKTLQTIIEYAVKQSFSRPPTFYVNYCDFTNISKRIPVDDNIKMSNYNLFTVKHIYQRNSAGNYGEVYYVIHEILKYGKYRQILFYEVLPDNGVYYNRHINKLIIPNPETRTYKLKYKLTVFI